MGARERRILETEQAFRAINERLREDLARIDDGQGPVAFVCECGHSACHESVELTAGEYTTAHARDDQFVALADHVIPEVEVVIARTDRFVVLRKTAG